MKKILIPIALLIVIGCIVGVLIYLNNEKPLEENRTLYSYKDNAVEEIHIVSEFNEVRFVKEEGSWIMTEPGAFSIDAAAVERLENRLKDFLASRVMKASPEDLQVYGLVDPKATISFRLDDGTQNTLYIGDMTASKVQYYAKDSAREQVYILGSYDVENFLAPVNDFRDRTILTIDAQSISTISLSVQDTLDFRLVGKESSKWSLTEPLEISARGDAVDELLNDILDLRIKDFITANTDGLGRYGLEKPSYTLEIGDNKKQTQKIYFGKIDDESQVAYIRIDDQDEVCTLSLEVFDPRRFNVANFLNEAPLSIAIGDVNKVTIIENDRVIEFDREANNEEDVFTFSGKEINQEDFTALYVNIMALTAEGYDPSNKGGKPVLTVILHRRDNNEKVKVEFVQRDDLTYYMILNGEARPFYIGERKVELISWWRDKVLGIN